MTIVALYFWPWQWSLTRHAGDAGKEVDEDDEGRAIAGADISRYEQLVPCRGIKLQSLILMYRLRLCLVLAALACILRPTNILIWMTLASFTAFGSDWSQRMVLVREAWICG